MRRYILDTMLQWLILALVVPVLNILVWAEVSLVGEKCLVALRRLSVYGMENIAGRELYSFQQKEVH